MTRSGRSSRQSSSRGAGQRRGLRRFVLFSLLLLLFAAASPKLRAEIGQSHFVIIGGLGGEPEYEEKFASYADSLVDVFEKTTGDRSRVHMLKGPEARREAIVSLLRDMARQTAENDSFALILVGHGTWDGRAYKFNIPGPDLASEKIRELLDAVPARRQLVTVTSSASGALIDELESPDRVIITATRSGRERNATIFPRYWVEALGDEAADSDKDAVISAAEAYQYAERRVKDFFATENRIASEHPRVVGGFADTFPLARLEKVPGAAADAAARRLLLEREAIEGRIQDWKKRKDDMGLDAYYDQLEVLLIELATKQAEIDEAVGK